NVGRGDAPDALKSAYVKRARGIQKGLTHLAVAQQVLHRQIEDDLRIVGKQIGDVFLTRSWSFGLGRFYRLLHLAAVARSAAAGWPAYGWFVVGTVAGEEKVAADGQSDDGNASQGDADNEHAGAALLFLRLALVHILVIVRAALGRGFDSLGGSRLLF